MQRDRIERRLQLLENNNGSIVATAAWAALNAADGHVIIAVVGERLASASTPNSTKAALLFVLHELLLSCAASATANAGRRVVIGAVMDVLPGALAAAVCESGNTEDKTPLLDAVRRISSWWRALGLFPSAWLAEVFSAYKDDPAAAASPSLSNADHGVVSSDAVARATQQYHAAKDRYESMRRAEGAQADMLESAREDALRSLYALTNALEERKEKLAATDLRELNGTEDNLGATMAPEDDVLGSFF